MTLYVDGSALLKLYVDEVDSDRARAILQSDPVLVTSTVEDLVAGPGVRFLDQGAKHLRAMRSALAFGHVALARSF